MLTVAKRDPALDGLRGLAVLLVFVFHYGGGVRAHLQLIRSFGYVAQAGWIGVELFFALSGFLITTILLGERESPHVLPRFYLRRALRILPLYLAALGLCAGAALAAGSSVGQLRPLLLYAAFLQNIPTLANAALHTPSPLPLFHLWSLAVEEQFYLVWPWLVLLAGTPHRVLRICIGSFCLTSLLRLGLCCTPHYGQLWSQVAATLPLRAGALAGGSALACLRLLRTPQVMQKLLRWLAATAFLGELAVGRYSQSFLLGSRASLTLGLTCVDLGATAVVGLALAPGHVRRMLSLHLLGALGRISYGFYVFHILLEPVFDFLGRLLSHQTAGFAYQGVRLFVAFPLTVAAAFLSFFFLERPFLQIGRRRFSPTSDTQGGETTLDESPV